MTGRAQKHFLWFMSVSLCAVLVLLLVAMNTGFSTRLSREADVTLEVILLYGNAPQNAQGVEFPETDTLEPGLAVRSPYQLLRTTNYFTAEVSPRGDTSFDLAVSADISSAEAEEALDRAQREEGGDSGEVGVFAFLRSADTDGTVRYAFMDIAEQQQRRLQLATLSLIFGSMAAACILICAWAGARVWVRPLEEENADSRELMQQAGETLQQSDEPDNTVQEMAHCLLAGSAVLEAGTARRTTFSMTDMLAAACEEAASDIEQKGGTLTADVEPDIFVRGVPSELQTMCRILLEGATRAMRPCGDIRVDLLTDGRQVGIVVQSICELWEDGSPPSSADIAAIRMLARASGGRAVFVTIPPDTVCTSVQLIAA